MATIPRSILLTSTAAGLSAFFATGRLAPTQLQLRVAAAALVAACSFDMSLFARIWLLDAECWLRTRLSGYRSVLTPDTTRFRCLPTLLDRNNHMNNAAHFWLLNFARRRFWLRNGGWRHINSRVPKANFIVQASTIRCARRGHTPRCAHAHNARTIHTIKMDSLTRCACAKQSVVRPVHRPARGGSLRGL